MYDELLMREKRVSELHTAVIAAVIGNQFVPADQFRSQYHCGKQSKKTNTHSFLTINVLTALISGGTRSVYLNDLTA